MDNFLPDWSYRTNFRVLTIRGIRRVLPAVPPHSLLRVELTLRRSAHVGSTNFVIASPNSFRAVAPALAAVCSRRVLPLPLAGPGTKPTLLALLSAPATAATVAPATAALGTVAPATAAPGTAAPGTDAPTLARGRRLHPCRPTLIPLFLCLAWRIRMRNSTERLEQLRNGYFGF